MADLFSAIYAFLFKYPPEVFRQGTFSFTGVPGLTLILVAVAVVAVPVVGSYRRAAGRARDRDRVLLAGLRLGAVGLVAFCLARPALELSSAVPQRNFVGVLVDDSRSMSVADEQGRPRADLVRGLISRDSALVRALSSRFQLRFFRFGNGTSRIEDLSTLAFNDEWTRLTPAIVRAREELAQVPLAGLVVLTDGAENPATIADSLNDVVPAGVPLYLVGIGQERFERDIEIVDVQTPAAVLQGSTMAVDVSITQSGYSGTTVRLTAEESGRILATREVKLEREGSGTAVRLHVPAPEPGVRNLRFTVAPAAGEIITENNRRDVVTTVRRGPERILYYEGEPRFELKFLRRAIAEDPNLQLITLLRTAKDKYLRLGIDDSLELVGGFPTTREELFRYQAVVLGSVEASALSVEQLRMLADFVSVRGGGLLVLGGRRALAEGGYAETPISRVLPVMLGDPDTAFFAPVTVRLTLAGTEEPALQLLGDDQATAERWRTLPPLSAVNRIVGIKPGATTMLEAEIEGRSRPVLAWQRYGRGKAIAFGVQDTWLWQMHADIPLEDETHETLWRQLLRWLVRDVPERVNVALSGERVPPGEPVGIGVNVMNARYDAVNSDLVTARITGPTGRITELTVPWSGTRDGIYEIPFTTEEAGRFDLEIEARAAPDSVPVRASASFTVGDSDAELKGATMQATRLRQMAEGSGGRFYTPRTVGSLPDDIAMSGAGITVRESRDLWDMPVLFLLLVGLLGTEWGYRRWRGLA
jgi:uncharacterized membrane protein